MNGRPSATITIAKIIGPALLVVIWLGIKWAFDISDRYLPSLQSVILGFNQVEPSLFLHTAATALRLIVGGLLGTLFGIGLALAMHRYPGLNYLLGPSVQALRSVPPIATVPFFLIWFGFAESGKLLLIVLGIGLNVLVGALQILEEFPEKYRVALSSMGHTVRYRPLMVALPLLLERLLPTIRASLSIAFGVVIVAELLGSQLGLGYLIQTSRTTYSIHVIFLAAGILGVLNALADFSIRHFWRKLVFWTLYSNGERR